MLIRVDRYLSTAEATLSRVYVDGAFMCFGLEDEAREIKVKGETRIPAGAYRVTDRKEGRLYDKYSNDRRFRAFHKGRGMLWVRNVPGFEYILIHPGNTEKETDGCLLVGMARDETTMTVSRSGEAYGLLWKHCIDAAEQGRLTISYEDNDR